MKKPITHLIVAFVVLCVVCAAYALWYRAIAKTSAELATIKEQVNAGRGSIEQQVFAHTIRTQLDQEEALVQSYLVSEEEAPSFINELESSGRRQGTEVTTVSIQKEDGKGKSSLILSLTVRGLFANVLQTVGVIENAQYRIALSSLTLTHEEGSVWRADIKMSVSSPTSKP